jgi:hypothetical protein
LWLYLIHRSSTNLRGQKTVEISSFSTRMSSWDNPWSDETFQSDAWSDGTCLVGEDDPIGLPPDWTAVIPPDPTNVYGSALPPPPAPEPNVVGDRRTNLCSPHDHWHVGSSVRAYFMNGCGVEPNREVLNSLRELFPCTGRTTRDEKRSRPLHWEAFERHRAEVFAQLADPSVLCQAWKIVLLHSHRRSTQGVMAYNILHPRGHN